MFGLPVRCDEIRNVWIHGTSRFLSLYPPPDQSHSKYFLDYVPLFRTFSLSGIPEPSFRFLNIPTFTRKNPRTQPATVTLSRYPPLRPPFSGPSSETFHPFVTDYLQTRSLHWTPMFPSSPGLSVRLLVFGNPLQPTENVLIS